MIRNYFTIALRNLFKHKVFSFINILGLSVGIACCILLSLYIKDEFSYEQHFSAHDRIYRVNTTFIKDGKAEDFPGTSPGIAAGLAAELPEIEIATRWVTAPEVEQHLIRYKDKSFFEPNGYMVDSTFFDVFDFEFQEGDAATVLDGPSTVVLSSEVAEKIFNKTSGIDELIIINSGWSTDTFRVTGVLKPMIKPSHVNAGFYMCMNSRGWGQYWNSVTTWAWQNIMNSYVKLKPGTRPENVDAKIPSLIEKHVGADLKNAGLQKILNLQALDDIRLYSDFNSSFAEGKSGTIKYVYILSSIGLFILLIACINFMNLTTAKASQRAGEVGVRKSLGATRKNLIGQFLGESFTLVTVSVLVSLVLVQLALPFFNDVTKKQLHIDSTNILYLAGALLTISTITGLVAGSYPAFFLSSFQPARVLKDKRLSGGGVNFLRKSLVVLQFVISITLVSTIVIIRQQLHYIQNQPLGFNPDYRIIIPLRTAEAKNQYLQLRNAFDQIAGVKNISAASSLPSTPLLRDFLLYPEGSSKEKGILHRNVIVDEGYFEAMDIKLIAGRDLKFEIDSFSWENTNRKIIVNRASLKELQLDLSNAIGTNLKAENEGRIYNHEIIGVIEDFHQSSFHQKIHPFVFYIPAQQGQFAYLTASLEGGTPKNILRQMEEKWKTVVPTTPFESQFLSDSVNKQYEADQLVSAILTTFSVLAILISCLGLYGLSIYVAERKVKEIGIRKVLGASVTSIVSLLSKEFVKLILIAFIVATPVGYYAMDRWLQSFEYKTALSVLPFVMAGGLSFAIAWVTIGFESVRAAIANPVDSLRNE